MITQERLKELWDYNAELDQFTWKVKWHCKTKDSILELFNSRISLDGIRYNGNTLKDIFLTGNFKKKTDISSTVSLEELYKVLHYNKDTGIFTWLENRTGSAIKGSIAGSLDNYGYFGIALGNKKYKSHRLAWFYIYKVWPTYTIDHIDRNRCNNAISNLRDVTLAINNKNKLAVDNYTSGFSGVTKNHNKWQANITTQGEKFYLGTFSTPEEASNAYLLFKEEYKL